MSLEITENNNRFLGNHDLWDEIAKSIPVYEEMIVISPFIDAKQLNSLREIIVEHKENKRFKIKILTTTFDGRMQYLAVDEIEKFIKFFENNYPSIDVHVKIEDARQNRKNRLHVKSYIFRNDSSTAGVVFNGSSNLTNTGMHTGTEWNLKITKEKDPNICELVNHQFKNLWERNKNLYDVKRYPDILGILYKYKINLDQLAEKEKVKPEVLKIIDSYPKPLFQDSFDERSRDGNNWLIENTFDMPRALFLQYAALNNQYLIENFIQIIKNKELTGNHTIDNLFIVSFVGGYLKATSKKSLKVLLTENDYKRVEDIIFDKNYRSEMVKVLQLLEKKLFDQSSSLINNKDFKHTLFTHHQCKALALHADFKDIKHWNVFRSSGVEVSRTPGSKIALFTDENNSKSAYGYQDYYDRSNESFKWFAPRGRAGWSPSVKHKTHLSILNGSRPCLVFHKTEYLKSTFKKNEPKILYEYLGEVDKVVDDNWLEEKKQLVLHFKFDSNRS